VDTAGPLTDTELRLLDLTGQVAAALRQVIYADDDVSGRCSDETVAAADWGEAAHAVHVIQRAVMAQAAARAYPDRFRLLGRAHPAAPPGMVHLDQHRPPPEETE
jgi:hypothetical protein